MVAQKIMAGAREETGHVDIEQPSVARSLPDSVASTGSRPTRPYRLSSVLLALLALALLLGPVWLVFGGAVEHYFAQDDFVFLSRSAGVKNLGDWAELILTRDHFYRPLPRAVLLTLEWWLFGLQASEYHLVSIALHTVNAWLVHYLGCMMTGRRLVSLLAALAYAVHPAHYVSVYWVSGIQELALAFFYLVTILSYLQYLWAGRRSWYWIAVLSFLMGILSKEMSITLPAGLLLLDMTWKPKVRTVPTLSVGRLADVIPVVVLAGAAVLLRLIQADGASAGPYAPSLTVRSLLASAHWFGLRMTGVHWLIPENTVIAWIILASVTLLALAITARMRSSASCLGIGVTVFNLAFLLPFSQHRFAYYLNVPLIGVALTLAGIVSAFLPANRRLGYLPFVLLVAAVVSSVLVGKYGLTCRIQEDPVGLLSKSAIARTVADRTLERYPSLPSDATLYLTDSNTHRYWAVGLGRMFNLLYGPDLKVRFEHLDPLTIEELSEPGLYSVSLSP